MKHRKLCLALLALSLVSSFGFLWLKETGPGADMTVAGGKFLATLSAEQKTVVLLKYDDPARLDWHFIPKATRKGLQVKEMNAGQRQAAHALLSSALSQLGYEKAQTIMSLESILHELEKSKTGGNIRDPQRYYVTLFGEPKLDAKWGLSIEGHHLSLNFVVQDGKIVSSTPSFFGANPAEVKSSTGVGPKPGTRVLKLEETLAFDLLKSLDEQQKKAAVISTEAPKEIRAAGEAQAPSTPPEGLAADKLNDSQRKTLRSLIEAYAANMPKEVADERLKAIREAGVANIRFAWYGASQPGVGHYYRVDGPTFLIEFVNVQPDAAGNPANHIHSVWRDVAGDFAIPRK
ncbi:MAG: DUF3500 domain-containing protein [Pirellulales bacterium]